MTVCESASVNTWEIQKIKNPCPVSWPGQWFSFKSWKCEGQANYKTLHGYLPESVYAAVVKHFKIKVV